MTTIGDGGPNQYWWIRAQHSAAPLERYPGTFIAQPNRCCAHNPRVSPHHLVQLARAQFRAIAGTPIRNEHTTATRTASSSLHTMHRNSRARMPQLLGRFVGKTCMKRGVVKPHLIENKNSYEHPRAGNEQTIGRQRVGIPLEPRLQSRQKARPLSAASGQLPFVPRDC